MKVLLIQPNSVTARGILTPPLALLFVGEIARLHGHEVRILDRNVDFNTRNFIKKFKPDVVGISVFTGPLVKDAITISTFIKEELGDETKVIWGGIHPSLLPEETVSNSYIDAVVIGEGELTFVELLAALEKRSNLSEVKGICYKENGRIITTPERGFLDLDTMPLTNWSLINAKRYLDLEIVMVTSRGCPYNCYFCYNQAFNKRKWRAQSAERVLDEIRRVESLTSNRHLKFHDDNFTVNKERVIKILKGLSKNYSLYIETRPEHVDKDFLDALKKFRKVWLFIGVETGSEVLLKSMNKMITLEVVRKAFKLIQPYKNIFTTASVILGLPGETYEESLATVAFVKSLKPTWITYCGYTPYPGSYYYDSLIAQGVLKVPHDTLAWASYTTPEIGRLYSQGSTISKAWKRELRKLNFQSWVDVFINILLKRDFHKIYRFCKDKVLRFPLRCLSVLGRD